MIENQDWYDAFIRTALMEDLGSGDLTTDAIIGPEVKGEAFLVTREQLVLAGLPVFGRVFKILDSEIEIEYHFEDGEHVEAQEKVCLLRGSLAAILKGERTALNFVQRMSGIATLTREYMKKIGSQKVRVVDTRKTTPGLRVFEKYAVRMGGGSNHRMGLFDGVLIKDNHIIAAGSITKAVSLAKEKAPHTVKVQVEVEDLAGLKEALQAGADLILLDNMAPDEIREAVKLVGGRVMVEASGGINIHNIEEIARTGVDIISSGALTHSVHSMDLGLDFI